MGIKGASVLCTQPSFDLCTGVVIDVMCCVFLGVMEKSLMGFWFGVSHRGSPYSIKSKVIITITIGWYLGSNDRPCTDYPVWWKAHEDTGTSRIQSPSEKPTRFSLLERYSNSTNNIVIIIHHAYLLYLHVASEFRSWLLYHSLPVLHGILSDPYFTH